MVVCGVVALPWRLNDSEAAALIASLRPTNSKQVVERAVLVHIEAFDWNCPQHVTPCFTQAELEPALAPIRERIAKVEAENAILRAKLASA